MVSQVTQRKAPGESELWIFILGDMFVFLIFFTIWSIQKTAQPELFEQAHAQLNMKFGLVNTLALLSSSLFVALALIEARTGRISRARKYLYFAMALGAVFMVIKFFEYREKILHGLTPMSNDFFMYYFIFTGIHLIHVIVGIVALLLMILHCQKTELTATDLPFLEGASVYWHMVDVLWVVLFLLIYLI